MDGELVTSSPSGAARGGGESRPPPFRYGDKFEEFCSLYMSLGMSYHDYWDGDPLMAKYYREAENLRLERENNQAWIQGFYVYRAILSASPVINALSKRKTPHKYLECPVPLTESANERAKEEENRKKMDNGLNFMKAMMTSVNAKFKKGEVTNGG